MSRATSRPTSSRTEEILRRLERIELLLISSRQEEVEGNEPPDALGAAAGAALSGEAAGLADEETASFTAALSLAAEFEQFIDRLGFPNFRGSEFTPYWSRVRNGVRNSPPPRELWPNIVPTIVVLQAFRTEFGSAVKLLSTYRSPDYNRAVGGATSSLHKSFKAIDFTVTTGTPGQWAERLRAMRGKSFRNPDTGQTFRFRGGVGVYRNSHFVHVDTRGSDADWTG